MNKFYKASYEEFSGSVDWMCDFIESAYSEDMVRKIYDNIKLPRQATPGSAGHDFFSPIDFTLKPNETIKIPTGIRVQLDAFRMLAVFPRSGLGFKYRLQLDNTVGIVDTDYFNAKNEGHIFIKVTNDSKDEKIVSVKAGEAFAQGIIIPYEIAVGSEADQDNIRVGGLGSTSADRSEGVEESTQSERIPTNEELMAFVSSEKVQDAIEKTRVMMWAASDMLKSAGESLIATTKNIR